MLSGFIRHTPGPEFPVLGPEFPVLGPKFPVLGPKRGSKLEFSRIDHQNSPRSGDNCIFLRLLRTFYMIWDTFHAEWPIHHQKTCNSNVYIIDALAFYFFMEIAPSKANSTNQQRAT